MADVTKEELMRRIERLEREQGLLEQEVLPELQNFEQETSFTLEDLHIGNHRGPGADYAMFKLDRCANRTDFMAVLDTFASFRLYTPDESKHDFTTLEVELNI